MTTLPIPSATNSAWGLRPHRGFNPAYGGVLHSALRAPLRPLRVTPRPRREER